MILTLGLLSLFWILIHVLDTWDKIHCFTESQKRTIPSSWSNQQLSQLLATWSRRSQSSSWSHYWLMRRSPKRYDLQNVEMISLLWQVFHDINFLQGTGLQNLRECILWTQTKHDFEPKKKRPFWKQMSKNFIERYCYLIVFTTYVKAFHSRGE